MTTDDSVEKLVDKIWNAGDRLTHNELDALLTTFKDQCVREERENTRKKVKDLPIINNPCCLMTKESILTWGLPKDL